MKRGADKRYENRMANTRRENKKARQEEEERVKARIYFVELSFEGKGGHALQTLYHCDVRNLVGLLADLQGSKGYRKKNPNVFEKVPGDIFEFQRPFMVNELDIVAFGQK